MATVKLTFENPINVSAGVGDMIYAVDQSIFDSIGVNNLAGVIDSIPNKFEIMMDDTSGQLLDGNGNLINYGDISEDDFIMFQKSNQVNVSSLNGYYAQIRLENASSDKVELFSLGSEVTMSSK